jgi:hypothetical protein
MTEPSTTQTRELKPCPFCSKQPLYEGRFMWHPESDLSPAVMCPTNGCPASGLYVPPERWNSRAPSDTEQRLREMVQELACRIHGASHVGGAHPVPFADCQERICVEARAALQPKAEQEQK